MPTFVEHTVKDIDARLGELRAERSRLEAARVALLDGAATRTPPRRPTAGRSPKPAASATNRAAVARQPARPRGRRGASTRADQALALVRKQPGATIPELAQAMKIVPNYLYRVLPKLALAGQVKRDGNGWHPTS
jgi:hypothetical protein